MFHLAQEMHTASAAAFFKAAGNRVVAHACKAARNDVLAKHRLALPDNPWDDNVPTLDARNEQDENARGDADRREPAQGSETGSTEAGFQIPMSAIQRCEILVGLDAVIREECAAFSSKAFDQPQTFSGYVKYIAGLDRPFNPSAAEKQKDQALIEAGLLTQEQCDADRIKQVGRVGEPYRRYGTEILQVIASVYGEADKNNLTADESWFERLPKWEQLQLIEETASGMKSIASQKALQSKRPGFGVGFNADELVADALLIQKDAEVVSKYRVEFYKLHRHELEAEDAARQASRSLPI